MALLRATLFAFLLHAAVGSTLQHVTAPHQKGRAIDGENLNLPLDHPRLVRDTTRIVEQVHLSGGYPDEVRCDPASMDRVRPRAHARQVFVTWLTNQSSPSSVTIVPQGQSAVAAYEGSASAYTFLMDPSPYYGQAWRACVR